MDRAGTDESGFGLDFDARAQTIRVEAWGFWPIELCSAFGKALISACRSSAGVRRAEMETTRPWPLREEGEGRLGHGAGFDAGHRDPGDRREVQQPDEAATLANCQPVGVEESRSVRVIDGSIWREQKMTVDESEVRAATVRFYDALEAMVSGKGLGPMQEAWHHTERVTTGHPSGDWARGWDEVLATWQVFAAFGREGRGGSRIRDLSVHVYGDVAYATCSFVASPAFGSIPSPARTCSIRPTASGRSSTTTPTSLR